MLILIYPKVNEKIGNGKKNHLRILAVLAVDEFTTYRIEIAIGAIIPMMKYIIFTTSEPVSSFSKMKVRKYMKAGLAKISKRKRIQT